MVGVRRFELLTSRPRTERSTKLSHTPNNIPLLFYHKSHNFTSFIYIKTKPDKIIIQICIYLFVYNSYPHIKSLFCVYAMYIKKQEKFCTDYPLFHKSVLTTYFLYFLLYLYMKSMFLSMFSEYYSFCFCTEGMVYLNMVFLYSVGFHRRNIY